MAEPQLGVSDVFDENRSLPVHHPSQSRGLDDTPAYSEDRQGAPGLPSPLPAIASSNTSWTETDKISERPCSQGHHSKPVGVVKPMRPRLVALRANQRPRPLGQVAGTSSVQPASQGTPLSHASQHGGTTSGFVELPFLRNTAHPPNGASLAAASSSGVGVAEGARVVAAGPAMLFRLNKRCSELGRRNEALEQKLAAYRRFFSDKDNLKLLMHKLDTEGPQTSPDEEEDARQSS